MGWGRKGKGVSTLTVKQVLAAFLEQAADVERDEQLGSKGVAVQVTGQCKRTLQNWDQEEAAGGGLPMPALDLVGSTGIAKSGHLRVLSDEEKMTS